MALKPEQPGREPPPGWPAGVKPPHWHCPSCWGEDYRLDHLWMIRCNRCEPGPLMTYCTPMNCGSS